MENNIKETDKLARVNFYSAILTVVSTLITFAVAFFTPPLSGPLCKGACFEYPYFDIASRFPRDYAWMYLAIISLISFVVFMSCIYNYARSKNKIFGQIGLLFATISTTILLTDYFVQLTVIQPSILRGETAGIALITQYNSHGIFIALEELGFFLMSLALFFASFIFSGSKLKKIIRWTLRSSFILTILSFTAVSFLYGIDREYRFEIAVISFNWLAIIISGIMISILFKKRI